MITPLTRPRAVFPGAIAGFIVGGLYGLTDAAAAFTAIGFLFDPTPRAFLLVVWAVLNLAMVVSFGTALLAIAWPAAIAWLTRLAPATKKTAVAGLVLAVFAGGAISRAPRRLDPPPPSAVTATRSLPVLWVVIDTLRRDRFYGSAQQFNLSPKFGAWARQNVIFDDAESSAGWTIPATATLLTGVHNLAMDASAGRIPLWVPTIAEHLHASGYVTHAFVDNVIVEPRAGYGRGFQTFLQRSGFRFAFSLPGFRLIPRSLLNRVRAWSRASYLGGDRLTDAAVAAVAGHPKGAPPFFYVHYMDPHAPYHPHAHLPPDPPTSEEIDYYRFRDILRADGTDRPTPGQLERLLHRYDNEIRFLDPHLRRLLDAWERRFGPETLVVVTSDHGEEFLDHGHLGHGHTVHREIVNIPLVMHLPPDLRARLALSTVQGRRPTAQIDLLPTTLDAIGAAPIPAELKLQGTSLLDPQWHPRPLVAAHSRHGRKVFRYREQNAVFMHTHFYSGRTAENEFYRLSDDPTEQVPRAGRSTPGLERRGQLAFEALAAFFHSRKKNEPAPDTTESLRAIGYIQ